MPNPLRPRSGRRDKRAVAGRKGWFARRVRQGLRGRRGKYAKGRRN